MSQSGHDRVQNEIERNSNERTPVVTDIPRDRPMRAANTPVAISGMPASIGACRTLSGGRYVTPENQDERAFHCIMTDRIIPAKTASPGRSQRPNLCEPSAAFT